MKRVTVGVVRAVPGAAVMVIALAAAVSVWAQAPVENDLARLEAALAAAPDDLKAGNDYRMAVIAAAQGDKTTAKYDHAIAVFEKLVAANPNMSN